MNQLLKIGSNTQANLALRNLYRINNKVALHQERLSTGKRINSAKDDAAGFALAATLKERLSGMKIAKQNIVSNKLNSDLVKIKFTFSILKSLIVNP